MRRSYSKELANAVRDFLDGDDWHYSFDEDMGIFNFQLALNEKLRGIDYHVEIKDDEILCYGCSPVGGDTGDIGMMASLCEFFCRANYGLKNGGFEFDMRDGEIRYSGFEFDMRDGEIRYKSYLDCENLTPSNKVIANAVYCIASMFDRYSSGFLGIIFGGMNAETAVHLSERDRRYSSAAEEQTGESSSDDDTEDMSDLLLPDAKEIDDTDSDGSSSAEENGSVNMSPFGEETAV